MIRVPDASKGDCNKGTGVTAVMSYVIDNTKKQEEQGWGEDTKHSMTYEDGGSKECLWIWPSLWTVDCFGPLHGIDTLQKFIRTICAR